MRNEIILIGPMGVGKSHISRLLSKKTNKPHIEIDELRFNYYDEIGYDKNIPKKALEIDGWMGGLILYWKPFEFYAVKKILHKFTDCIFDFGAPHSIYDDFFMFSEIKDIFSNFNNIFFLLPSENREESLEFLKNRRAKNWGEPKIEHIEMLKYFMNHRSNYELCKHIVYVKNKSDNDIVEEIISISSKT